MSQISKTRRVLGKGVSSCKAKHDPPTVQKIAYDPEVFLREMGECAREKFEKLFPESLYDSVARHRVLVSGELPGCDFLDFDKPREGTFFLDQQGARMAYGRDIHAYANKRRYKGTVFDAEGREHFMLQRGRMAADRSIQYSYVNRHCSEKQWNLPKESDHHFLRLPSEIRTQILEYVLIAAAPVVPKAVVCTWKTSYGEPGYALGDRNSQLIQSKVKIPRSDTNGAYTEIRRIFRKPIDATCLRVSKQFLLDGSAILYGRNTFECSFIPDYLKDKGRLRTLGECGHPILRYSEKPHINEVDSPDYLQSVLDLMEGRETDDHLEDWIYCDPLLRFLRTIGPRNAATIRSLSLNPDPRLQHDLRLYEPFIRTYCLELGKLTIGPAWLDDHPQQSRVEAERAMFGVLRSQLARLPKLEEVVVIDDHHQLVAGMDGLMEDIRAQREIDANAS